MQLHHSIWQLLLRAGSSLIKITNILATAMHIWLAAVDIFCRKVHGQGGDDAKLMQQQQQSWRHRHSSNLFSSLSLSNQSSPLWERWGWGGGGGADFHAKTKVNRFDVTTKVISADLEFPSVRKFWAYEYTSCQHSCIMIYQLSWGISVKMYAQKKKKGKLLMIFP